MLTFQIYIFFLLIKTCTRRELGDKTKNRRAMLLMTAFCILGVIMVITLLSALISSTTFKSIFPFISSITSAFSWMPKTLITALFVSPVAFWLWHWRDQNKIKDQEHIERDLILKENKNDMEDFEIPKNSS